MPKKITVQGIVCAQLWGPSSPSKYQVSSNSAKSGPEGLASTTPKVPRFLECQKPPVSVARRSHSDRISLPRRRSYASCCMLLRLQLPVRVLSIASAELRRRTV